MDLELQNGTCWAENYGHDCILVTVGPKSGDGIVRVVECRVHSEGELEPLKVVEAWGEDGQDVPFQPEVPKDLATWICDSREVQKELDRLLSEED